MASTRFRSSCCSPGSLVLMSRRQDDHAQQQHADDGEPRLHVQEPRRQDAARQPAHAGGDQVAGEVAGQHDQQQQQHRAGVGQAERLAGLVGEVGQAEIARQQDEADGAGRQAQRRTLVGFPGDGMAMRREEVGEDQDHQELQVDEGDGSLGLGQDRLAVGALAGGEQPEVAQGCRGPARRGRCRPAGRGRGGGVGRGERSPWDRAS